MKIKIFILSFFILSGCTAFKTNIVLHPITPSDICSVKEGSFIIFGDDKPVPIEKDGWYVSDQYMKEVMETKVKK
jgi:hypothetical protein